ncbi:Hsp20/alpha crystallin family protein [Natrinema sp. SYSU A 869]|uniref:Hsp20/alpha crystallin family protein n=1 Tax=Natrinema sp. SYSU A 869 TaxID=2871694 RepID=UPI001CA3C7DA|nr:Hsp20/alpha crystallin family protein [Natrinema sp. SYSU A 869]
MSATPSSDAASFPFPTQFVYEGPLNRFRAAVDIAPTGIDDVTVEAGPRHLRVIVDLGDHVAERAVRPLPDDLVFGDDHEAVYNNGVLTVSLSTRSRE